MRRRDLLGGVARAGLAAAAIPPALRLLLDFEQARADGGDRRVEVMDWTPLPGKRVQCFVCPLHCILEDGQVCFCRTRENVGGRCVTNAYGNPCILRTDPIEKTPLNHFLPGSKVLSVATGGCNLRCLYCQNWREAQSEPKDLRNFDLDPGAAVRGAREQDIRTICFTYTEPVSFLEYVRDIAALAKERGVRTVMATAGFVEVKPLREMCRTVSAFAIALKGFDDAYYLKVCGQRMAPVLRALETVRAEGAWLEITTLLVPTLNDDLEKVRAQCRWIRRSLGPDVPLHFARFIPEHRLKELPRTPVSTLEDARKVALDEGLRFVYLSNVAPHEGNRTLCPSCRQVVIDRLGFKLLSSDLKDGACGRCGTKIPGLWG